jgi:hypothetical protein
MAVSAGSKQSRNGFHVLSNYFRLQSKCALLYFMHTPNTLNDIETLIAKFKSTSRSSAKALSHCHCPTVIGF